MIMGLGDELECWSHGRFGLPGPYNRIASDAVNVLLWSASVALGFGVLQLLWTAHSFV